MKDFAVKPIPNKSMTKPLSSIWIDLKIASCIKKGKDDELDRPIVF